jgi:NAD(P)-dependent dehydrogenase (short-subunit alcohol dehydrogenase family)
VNVLVTGGSSGIGAATARAFAERGDTVGICARRTDRLAEVLGDLPGGRMWTVDLADLDGLGAFAARADDELGGIDVLVNNAGVPKRRRSSTMSADDVESVMATNYFSPVRLTLALLPRMIERGRGDIVNVSSMGVHLVAFGVGAYAASKAALELFTEALYVELPGTGVRAHLLVPGTTDTEFSTPREGNDPPLPPGPSAATPEVVAAAIVACVESDEFVSYATEGDAATSAAKAADPNAFLIRMRDALAPLRG